MLKRPQYIALGVIILCTFVLLKLPDRAAANALAAKLRTAGQKGSVVSQP